MVHIFIINSNTGRVGFGEQLRQELSQIPGLTYFVFSTRKPGGEADLAELVVRLFENESIRIYCCGGSGTFRNVLNELNNPRNVELAFVPNGMSNDFLKVFGKEQSRFFDVKEVIDGEVIDIDYIETNYGRALNALSFGADSIIIGHVNKYRDIFTWSKKLPYVLAVIATVIKLKASRYSIAIDGIPMDSMVSEGILGNGNTIGGIIKFSDHAIVNDGEGRFIIVPTGNRFLLAKMIRKSVAESSSSVLNHLFHGQAKNFSIKKENGESFEVSLDGELIKVTDQIEASVVKNGIRFVVPKGVSCP